MYLYGRSYFIYLSLVSYFIVYLQILQMLQNLSITHSKNEVDS